MENILLEAKAREKVGRVANFLRKTNFIPAVLFGHNIPNKNLIVPQKTFSRAFKEAGESTLVDLKIDEAAPVKVLIQDIQTDPLDGEIIHVDFYQVSMTEKLEADILFNFVGESPAVKDLGGILVKSLDHLRVKCLPGDLAHQIDVPLGSLKNFGDVIHIKDIKLPQGMEILDNANEVIATVTKPISEEELKAMEEKPVADVTAIKTEGEEKKAKEEIEKAAVEAAK